MDQRSKWIVFALVFTGAVVVDCILLALLAGALSWRVTSTSVPQIKYKIFARIGVEQEVLSQ